jgi:hypothetical protein
VSIMLLMRTGALLRGADLLGCCKVMQFTAILGHYSWICTVDRTVLAPLLSYQVTDMIISVAGACVLLAGCSMVPRPWGNSANRLPLRQPCKVAVLLSVACYGLLALRIVQQTEEPQRPPAGYGRSGLVVLTV